MSVVIVVFSGDGMPKMIFAEAGPALAEAYDVLKRGVLGHFQPIPATRASDLEAAVDLLLN